MYLLLNFGMLLHGLFEKYLPALLKLAILLLSLSIHQFTCAQLNIPNSPELKRLSNAIQIETVSSHDTTVFKPGTFKRFIDFLQESYPLVNKHLELTIINNYSILYCWKGKDQSALPGMFLSHYDVVPVESCSYNKWGEPPFSGHIDEQYVWGRGSIDNKFQLMALMETIENLLSENYIPLQTIYFAFGHDEEIGGTEGAAKVAKYFQLNNMLFEFIIDEGGAIVHNMFPGIKRDIAFIATGEKGDLNVELSVQEKGGHSSVPQRENAIDILANAISKIKKKPIPARLQHPTDKTLDSIAPYLDGKTKFAIRNKWLFKKRILKSLSENYATNAIIRTVITPTIIQSGIKENALPTLATANLNIRILQGNNIEYVLKYLQNTIKDTRVFIRMKNPAYNPSPISPAEGKPWNALYKTIQSYYPGIIVAPMVSPATTDSRHYASLCKNIFRFTPFSITAENKECVHGINEKIGISEYLQAISFYTSLIKNIDRREN